MKHSLPYFGGNAKWCGAFLVFLSVFILTNVFKRYFWSRFGGHAEG